MPSGSLSIMYSTCSRSFLSVLPPDPAGPTHLASQLDAEILCPCRQVIRNHRNTARNHFSPRGSTEASFSNGFSISSAIPSIPTQHVSRMARLVDLLREVLTHEGKGHYSDDRDHCPPGVGSVSHSEPRQLPITHLRSLTSVKGNVNR